MERSPSVCGSRTIDPRFLICFLGVLQDDEDLIPVALFCSVEEIGTLFVVCTIRCGWKGVGKPNGRRRCRCHWEISEDYNIG